MEQDGLVEVGEYRRDLSASLDRMFENALDWEHLPHLHAGSFTAIECVRADDRGWRATATTPGGAVLDLDLSLDPAAGRWITTTHAGGRLVGRIVTDAAATGARSCRIHIRFHADAAEAEKPVIADFYRTLYARLYDEDEAMMVARQHAIDNPDRRYRIVAGHRVPNACPHRGLPLDAEPDDDGIITCPWHGYRFDIATGRCVSGAQCGWHLQP